MYVCMYVYIYIHKPEVMGWQVPGEYSAIVGEFNDVKVEEPLKMRNCPKYPLDSFIVSRQNLLESTWIWPYPLDLCISNKVT